MKISKASLSISLTFTGVMLFAIAIWLVILSPRISTSVELKQQAIEVEQSNLLLAQRNREMLVMAKTAPAIVQEAQKLFSRMPESAQLPEVLRQITQAAVSSGISTRNIQMINATIPTSITTDAKLSPNETVASANGLGVNLATMKIEIAVSGSEQQRLNFLERLQKLNRGLLITSDSVTTDGVSTNTGTLAVTGTMFVLESKLPDLVANAQTIINRALQQVGIVSP